ETQHQRATNPKVGLMHLKPIPGEYKVGVAVREGTDLWLLLWGRRTTKGGGLLLKPMKEPGSKNHTKYHLHGHPHMKKHGQKVAMQKGQPPNGAFRGAVELYGDVGFSPKGVGAVCDPTVFSGVVELPSGVLGPRHGEIVITLVEPGIAPLDHTWHA